METKTLKIDSELHEKLKTLATGSKYSIQDIVESKLQELLEHKEDMIFQFEKDIEYNYVKDTYNVKLKSYSYHKLIDFLEIFLSNRNLNNVQEIKAVLEASEFLKSYSNDRSKKINTDNYMKDDFYERLDYLLCVNYSKYDDTKFPFNVPYISVLIDTKTLNCYRKISDEYIVRLKQDLSKITTNEYLTISYSYNINVENLIKTRNKIVDKYTKNNNECDEIVFKHLNTLNRLITETISTPTITRLDRMISEYNDVYHWLNIKHIKTDVCLQPTIVYSDIMIDEFISSLNLPFITTIEDIKDIENRERFDKFIVDMFHIYNKGIKQELGIVLPPLYSYDHEFAISDINGSINIKDLDKIQNFIKTIKNKEVVFNIPVDFAGTIYDNVMNIINSKCVIVKD